MKYYAWLAERFRDVLSRAPGHRYMPYERTVCNWAWNLRLIFVLVPAFAMTSWWQVWWPLFLEILPPKWILWLWCGYTVWGAGWLGGFTWADLGPGELFIKSLIHRPGCSRRRNDLDTVTGLTWRCCGGTSYVPNIANTTLEGWEGPKESYRVMVVAWLRLRYALLRPFDGDPRSGRFGDQ